MSTSPFKMAARSPHSRPMLRLLAYAGAFIAIGLAGWIDSTFGEPSVDQILYHLRYAEGAAIRMGELFALTLFAEVFAFPLAFALLATLLHEVLARRWPALARHVLPAAVPLAVLAGLAALLLQFSLFSYAAAHLDTDRFAERFVDPHDVQLHDAGPRRNLVLIYVESLEEGYGDARHFGRDLLAPLKQLGGSRLAALRQVPGTTWTIAGMVASQCGVPLKVYSELDVKRADTGRSFLPGATCLGDVLRSHGWRNVFLGGAPLSFAGKGRFLRDHGYAETYGRDEWERAGVRSDEMNEWGLYDSALFERAKNKLAALHAAGEPFNLTLLTLDTHNPGGFLSPYCRQRGARTFADIVECTSVQVAQFVEFANDHGYLADTTIVIVGDHLAAPNPVYEELQRTGERQLFNLVVSDRMPAPLRRVLVPFDLYPTLLELLGLRPDGGRLGLGISAFSEAPPLQPTLPLAALTASDGYRQLWRHEPSR